MKINQGIKWNKNAGSWYTPKTLSARAKETISNRYRKVCRHIVYAHVHLHIHTVDSRYLELAYLEWPLITKWKSGPCLNMKI